MRLTAWLLGASLLLPVTVAQANQQSAALSARGAREIYNLDRDLAVATYRQAIQADPQDVRAYGNMTVDDYLGRVRARLPGGFTQSAARYGSGSAWYPSAFPYPQAAPRTYTSPAVQAGYRDGFEVGRNDARDRERFDPARSRRYRSADRDYDRRFGSKNEYQREYRTAFERGYAEGYRGARIG